MKRNERSLRPFLFAALLLLPLSRVTAFNARTPFDISADMVEYSDPDQSMTAEGHVVVIQGTSTLKADSMRYERQTQRLWARGHVVLNDNGSVLLGETMDYDLVAESGTVTSALGYQRPWIFSGATWQKNLDYYAGTQASFTSCDLVDPHYHIRASRVHLVPDSHFWSWNNVAYADKVPVFYSPFIYKNLAKRRVVIQFQPGHDSVNGNFLKTQTTVRFTDLIYDKVLYDYYSEQGNGIGNEFNYVVPGKMKGSLFGYYIDPRGNPALAGAPETEQHNIRSYHWQQINPAMTLQSNVNIRQNVSFNNRYFQQDTNQSVNDITSSVALTHQRGRVNQRLVVEALQAPDATDTNPFPTTHIQSASLPRYDITMYQTPLWTPKTSTTTASANHLGPLTLNANATLGNTYQRLDKDMHANAQGSFTLSDGIVLSRAWSFTPTLTPQLNWQDKFNAQPPAPVGSTVAVSNVGLFKGYQGRLGTADTLRWRPLSSLSLDQTYSLTARMEPNGTDIDRDLSDNGIETHHLSELLFWRPSRQILMRSFSGFDLRRIDDEDPNTYRQRKWDPWTSEITLNPNRRSEYFARYQMGFYPTRDQLWEGAYRFFGPYSTRLQTGLLYNRGTPGTLTWNNNIGIFFSPGWRVDATLHALIPSTTLKNAVQKGTFIDDEFIVTRDMHCWQAQFVYRNIPPLARTYSLQFNLKLGVKAEKEITNQELETQFYPWRANTYAN